MDAKPRYRLEERDITTGDVTSVIDRVFGRELDRDAAMKAFTYQTTRYPDRYAWNGPKRLVVMGPDRFTRDPA